MQNTVKTVDVLPNLPAELDIVVLRPSDRVVKDDPRYQRQFRSDFRVRKGRVMTWLGFLKAHHPDYQHVMISSDRIDALPADEDVSSSFAAIVNDQLEEVQDQPPTSAELPPPNSYSMVPNLNITTTEVDLIFEEIAGQKRPLTVTVSRSVCAGLCLSSCWTPRASTNPLFSTVWSITSHSLSRFPGMLFRGHYLSSLW